MVRGIYLYIYIFFGYKADYMMFKKRVSTKYNFPKFNQWTFRMKMVKSEYKGIHFFEFFIGLFTFYVWKKKQSIISCVYLRILGALDWNLGTGWIDE